MSIKGWGVAEDAPSAFSYMGRASTVSVKAQNSHPTQQSCWALTPADKLLSSGKEWLFSPSWLTGTHAIHAGLIKALLSLLHHHLPPVLLSIPVIPLTNFGGNFSCN